MTWHQENTAANFNTGKYYGTLDISAPQDGITVHQTGVDSVTRGLLGVTFADAGRMRMQDCYPRVDDFIAIYPQTSSRPFNVQLQYRIFAGGEEDSVFPADCHAEDCLLIEQWISNYTFSLDTHPQLDVQLFPVFHDSVDAFQVWQDIDDELIPLATSESEGANIAAIVAPAYGSHPALAVLIHPRDQADADFSVEGSSDKSAVGIAMLRLFDRFMEKGVIRRARLRLLVSRSPIDEDLLLKHYQHFANSPLPLTT